jgi:hypothetical protein
MENIWHLENYIRQRLTELDKEKDMQEVMWKGKLSFGIDSRAYSHLPNWKNLLQKKKDLVKQVWLNAVFLSLMVTGMLTDVWEILDANWLKAIIKWLVLSGVVMLFWVIASFYSMFYHFRKTEREVRRLIYEDILHQLKKEEKEAA